MFITSELSQCNEVRHQKASSPMVHNRCLINATQFNTRHYARKQWVTHRVFPQGAQSLGRPRDGHRNIPGLCRDKRQPRDSADPEEDGLEPLLQGRLGAWWYTCRERCVIEGFIEEVTFALVFDGYTGV